MDERLARNQLARDNAITLLVIAILSGALSLGILKKSQPADLLR